MGAPPPITGTIPSISSLVTFATQNIQPPSPLYVTRDDILQTTVYNSLAGQTVAVRYRLLRVDVTGPLRTTRDPLTGRLTGGRITTTIIPGELIFTPSSDRLRNDFFANLPEGFLLNVSCFARSATTRRGQTFAMVSLRREAFPAGDSYFTLISDYTVAGSGLSWPGGLIRQSIEGRGFQRTFTGTDPAAGTEVIEQVPTNALWRLVAVRVQLTTSATVATRVVKVRIDPPGGVSYELPSAYDHPASTTQRYVFSTVPLNLVARDSVVNVPIPGDFLLPQTSIFRTVTTNLQIGDDWTPPALTVEEWLEE